MSFGKVQLKQASCKVIFQGLCTTNCILDMYYIFAILFRALMFIDCLHVRLGPTTQSTTSHHREGNSKIDSLKSAEHKFSAFRIISRIITFYEAGGSSPVSKHGCSRHESFEGFRGNGWKSWVSGTNIHMPAHTKYVYRLPVHSMF